MNKYITKAAESSAKAVVLDDMILTVGMPTTAGSKMLDGYNSLFESEAVTKLKSAGYGIAGKANTGEFGLDFLGETSYFGACADESGNLISGCAAVINDGDAFAAVSLDTNGTPRRAAALAGLTCLKPTYGTVSRYGIIPAACSGEAVSVTAKCAADVAEVADRIIAHDCKDGTSLPEEVCNSVKGNIKQGEFKKVAVIKNLVDSADSDTQAKIASACAALNNSGIATEEINDEILPLSQSAWFILMSAEACNNISRYDGIKFGYRSPNYKNIDELYTNSRTEAFGLLTKLTVLYGSECLSDDNYMPVYDKAMRIRRVICEHLNSLFEKYDALLLPACSKTAYSEDEVKSDIDTAYNESLYTAPASISGVPAVACAGVQFIGKALSDKVLLGLAQICEKEA